MIAAAPPAPAPPPAHALVTLAPAVSPGVLGAGARLLDGATRTWIVRLPQDGGLSRLRALDGVVAAEPDRVRRQNAGPDPLLAAQTYLPQINWTRPAGPSRPLVAVLDTGVDGRARELQGHLAPGARSFVDDAPLTDGSGHGTHVAGLITATSRNGFGIAGIANARLLVVKIANRQGQATTSTLVQGIRYAVAHRAKIINISFGGEDFSRLEQRAILDARRAGVLVIAAAGNSGRSGSPIQYPGGYRHVLAVGAVRPDDAAVIDSTRGPQVSLAAPGKRILSLGPGGRFARRTGTSMATAIATGVAARLMATRPALKVSQVRSLLLSSARDVGSAGRDDATGWGVVDLAAVLTAPTPGLDGAEPNDDAAQARSWPEILPGGAPGEVSVRATIEEWADATDDYRVTVNAGEQLDIAVQGPPNSDLDLVVWRPGAPAFTPGAPYTTRWLAATSVGPGTADALSYTATQSGEHTVEVRAVTGIGRYRLTVRRSAAGPPLP